MTYQAVKRYGGKLVLWSEKRQSQQVVYCMIPAMLHSEKGKMMERVKRLVVSVSWGREEMEHRRCLGKGNYSVWYNNGGYISVYICPHRICSTKMNPSINCGLSDNDASMLCRPPFMLGDVDNGRDYACVGLGNRWETSAHPDQVCLGHKTTLKKVFKTWNVLEG